MSHDAINQLAGAITKTIQTEKRFIHASQKIVEKYPEFGILDEAEHLAHEARAELRGIRPSGDQKEIVAQYHAALDKVDAEYPEHAAEVQQMRDVLNAATQESAQAAAA